MEIIVKFIPEKSGELLEIKLSLKKGKWKNNNISNEVRRCLTLLGKINPRVFLDIGAY